MRCSVIGATVGATVGKITEPHTALFFFDNVQDDLKGFSILIIMSIKKTACVSVSYTKYSNE